MNQPYLTKRCKTPDMVVYSVGECANSLIMNSLFGFAMLYYTKALGLAPASAGLALFVAILWDAISDPVMGHISDNTRSRFGRRHPYILAGGLVMALSFFFLWYVPDFFKGNNRLLFWYLVVMNLNLRTAFTAFIVPYTALGFEICTDYFGRTKLQGIRMAMFMAANLAGPALSWTIFFGDNTQVRATQVPENYLRMGSVFALASLVFVLVVSFSTLKFMRDSRGDKTEGNTLGGFLRDMREIVTDIYARWVFPYIFTVLLGTAIASSLQMYVYEDFLALAGWQKTITHGGTMVAMGLGSLCSPAFVRKLDKKGSVFFAAFWSLCCNLVLAAAFLPGLLEPGQRLGGFPVSFVFFTVFHAGYWFGNGIMLPTATSMMADISEINQIKTGYNKDGGYSAVFSFAIKCAISLGTLVSGYTLTLAGYRAGLDQIQSPGTLWKLCAATFLAGPLISLTGVAIMLKYPVNHSLIEAIRQKHAGAAP